MKNVCRIASSVAKGTWKTITLIRLTLANLFFLALLSSLIYFAYMSLNPSLPKIQEKSALVLNLSGPIVERSSYAKAMDSLAGSLFSNDFPKENVLFDLVNTIRYAKEDNQISGIVLALRDMQETNITKLRYIASALNEFKSSGKPIYAVGDFYTQSQYYLASYANKVYLAPEGGVSIKGYRSYSMYYKTFLKELNINAHVFRVGAYKSAVEPFIRDDMSDTVKKSTSHWLNQLWDKYVDDVSKNRKIKSEILKPTTENFLAELKSVDGNMAALSLKFGLVDELATRQQICSELTKIFGENDKNSYNAIDYYDYITTIPIKIDTKTDGVAVIVASGTIVNGSQIRGTIAGDTIAILLQQAKNNRNIKAVVLRVDSPGGSAFASEVIRNEIQALKHAGKPVVVSMSSIAASGGYWISMSANKIIAQATTLTGSIGIFGIITTFEKILKKMGIHTDGVGTYPFSDVGVTTGLSQPASDVFQMEIEHGYQRFVTLVSKNRNITLKKMGNLAQGKIWTGEDAMELGLIDQIGNFDDAIIEAAKLAELETYRVYRIEEAFLSPTKQFFQDIMRQIKISLEFNNLDILSSPIKPLTDQMTRYANLLQNFNDPKGHYAFCLNCQIEQYYT
ncbi:protease 4 [Candidatus Photodesmus blepharus]|uniref:Protease 4 n=1 Tax=Candidatus Photodesmus blepharonis TaxID=1179155 RepID=A0A084CMR2_9GAMM|nr:signal peptide peptidase SppA [Candidatus Photodesmus blepharus]KEY91091.1 protease 4 [Candidatus Photodesmus blepharus]